MRISDWSSDVCSSDLPQPSEEPRDIAVQLFTSGTTGKPKAAILRHENLMSYIVGTVEFAAADDNDAIVVTVPPYHIAGISAVLSSTYSCRRMVLLPAFEPQTWLQVMRSERSEEHTSELQSLMRISYAVFCLKNKH